MNAVRELNTRLRLRANRSGDGEARSLLRAASALGDQAGGVWSVCGSGAGRLDAAGPANFRDWKHSLQNTGRPCVGLQGTVVSFPQAEHVV